LRQGSTHGRQAKVRKAGRHARAKPRHARPRQPNKAVKRAALIVPAIAAAGAVAAAVQAEDPGSPALGDAVGRVADGQIHAGHGGRHASASPSPTPTPAAGSGKPAVRCSGSSPMLPANYVTIVRFLTAHGYTKLAAAGMAGNMYQESKGDPESVGSGGGGLIGFTPLPPGYVTGNPAADLRTQLAAVLTYNQQWSQYIPALNAATSATAAADIYMNDFERPGIPAAYNREAAAVAVAKACGF
jgi:hypothetical protein